MDHPSSPDSKALVDALSQRMADGTRVAQNAYAVLLRLPYDSMLRIQSQSTLAGLCDFIARSTGRTNESVQDSFEQAAVIQNERAEKTAEARCQELQRRIDAARPVLFDMIDGADDGDRGRDSEVSRVIRILDGATGVFA